VQNYKSLHEVYVEPPAFFTVVGANAAGKTNFADVIEFLATIAKSGLAAALNEKGGYENVCFRRQRRSKGAITLGCVISNVTVGGVSCQMDMRFSFRAQKEAIRSSYAVESEHIELAVEGPEGYQRWLKIQRRGKDVSHEVFQEQRSARPFFVPGFLKELFEKDKPLLRDDDLLLWTYLRGLPPFGQILSELSRFRVFQIAPSFARKPGAASGN
jgi:predicted ATPase